MQPTKVIEKLTSGSGFAACAANGHLGPEVLCYNYEQDDDRQYCIKFYRCENCGIPVSGDEYVDREEEDEARAKGLLL